MTAPTVSRPKCLGLVAPSSFLIDPAQGERTRSWFENRGWQVKQGETCFARDQRFAGPDAMRADEFNRFCLDRSLDVVMAARGGYGLSRILELIDYHAIAAAGCAIVGYSDFTAFNLALLARSGGISFQGPSGTDFGVDHVDPFTAEQFMASLSGPQHAVRFDADGPSCAVTGCLWGGNLATVCALLATPFWPAVEGGILFLEDVNEAAYRIERMLLQLEHAGVLKQQKAVMLGSFDPMPVLSNDNGFDRAAVVSGLRKRLSIPVIDGLPFGHVPQKLTLPVGGQAVLNVLHQHAELSWDLRQSSSKLGLATHHRR